MYGVPYPSRLEEEIDTISPYTLLTSLPSVWFSFCAPNDYHAMIIGATGTRVVDELMLATHLQRITTCLPGIWPSLCGTVCGIASVAVQHPKHSQALSIVHRRRTRPLNGIYLYKALHTLLCVPQLTTLHASRKRVGLHSGRLARGRQTSPPFACLFDTMDWL